MSITPEYEVIAKFYGDGRARRSGVPLMNHIDEGLATLAALGATDIAKRAFCLHPIVQNSEPIDVSWSPAYELACEYRDRANAYLCRPETDWVLTTQDALSIIGVPSYQCILMLLADKTQNQKDFNLHHKRDHPRASELTNYFNVWIQFLYAMK